MRDRDTGRSRGFGFVTFSNTQEADAAIQGLNEQELDGRRIKVNMANARPCGFILICSLFYLEAHLQQRAEVEATVEEEEATAAAAEATTAGATTAEAEGATTKVMVVVAAVVTRVVTRAATNKAVAIECGDHGR
jgi:hypothetical protein